MRTPALVLRSAVLKMISEAPIADRWPPPSHSPSHRAHWLGWLQEYDGPGYYNRKVPRKPRSFGYIYGHIHCAPMLLWLAEVAGVRRRKFVKPIVYCAAWFKRGWPTAIRAVRNGRSPNHSVERYRGRIGQGGSIHQRPDEDLSAVGGRSALLFEREQRVLVVNSDITSTLSSLYLDSSSEGSP
jgi:hypothetical protein